MQRQIKQLKDMIKKEYERYINMAHIKSKNNNNNLKRMLNINIY
jgi:hypothetical protein